jgi:hypothetical protein
VSGPLDLARELEAEDSQLAREIEATAELQRRAAATGEQASGLQAFASALPVERERLAVEVRETEEELAARRAELDRAEAALAEEDDPEARRAVVRARDLLGLSRHRLERLRVERDELEARAAALPGEVEGLAGEAAGVTEALAHPPVTAPPPDLAALVDWASRAHAALLLRRSSLDARRDWVVREANELAALVLGDPLTGSVATVREHLERAG